MTREAMVNRQTLNRIALGVLVVITWLVVLLRIQPWPFSDYGVFLSVARRLNSGDVLYQGIWDNKDPFVYYSLAILQPLGQPGLWALEALWFVLAALSIYLISRRYGMSRSWSVLLGAVATPIVIIPFHYFPGTTHLPGISLSLVALALAISGRFGASGIALGLLFFFKLSMLPIALAGLAIVLLKRHSYRQLVPLAWGSVITLAVGFTIVTLRGELLAYLDSLVHNFTYSQTNTATGGTGPGAAISERITVLTDTHVLITVITIAGALAITASRRRTTEMWDVAAGTYLMAVLLIVMIGKFPHHAQVLGVSAALVLIVLALSFESLRDSKPLVSSTLVILLAVALAGVPYVKGYRDALLNPQGTWAAMTSVDPATQDLLSSGPPRSFAIVQGGGLPRSTGLEEWDLVCRHIAQRPWESAELLQESLDCFPNADVLLLPADFAPAAEPPAYANFTESVARLVQDDYVCSDASESTVCVRRSLS